MRTDTYKAKAVYLVHGYHLEIQKLHPTEADVKKVLAKAGFKHTQSSGPNILSFENELIANPAKLTLITLLHKGADIQIKYLEFLP